MSRELHAEPGVWQSKLLKAFKDQGARGDRETLGIRDSGLFYTLYKIISNIKYKSY